MLELRFSAKENSTCRSAHCLLSPPKQRPRAASQKGEAEIEQGIEQRGFVIEQKDAGEKGQAQEQGKIERKTGGQGEDDAAGQTKQRIDEQQGHQYKREAGTRCCADPGQKIEQAEGNTEIDEQMLPKFFHIIFLNIRCPAGRADVRPQRDVFRIPSGWHSGFGEKGQA